jgi:hypothetical protein
MTKYLTALDALCVRLLLFARSERVGGRSFPCVYQHVILLTRPLGGVIVSVLAIEPKVRGYKPSRGVGFLRAIKIRSAPSFRREVKPSAPCKILRHVKVTKKYKQRYFKGEIHHSLRQDPSASLLDDSGGRIARSLGGRTRSLPLSI